MAICPSIRKNCITGKILVHKLKARKFLSSQIAELFDHELLRKGPVNILELLYGASHQGKVASETTIFMLMLPGMPTYAQTCLDKPVLLIIGLGQMARLKIE